MLPRACCALFVILLSGVAFPADAETATEPLAAVMAPRAQDSLFLDIVSLSSNRLVAVGERGHIMYSDDAGASWTQAEVPTRATLTATHFATDQIGWAVGHDQTILRTDDGGGSWQLQHYSDDQIQPAFFDVLFFDRNRGIAVGSYGLYKVTSNGGRTWQEQYNESLDDPDFGLPHFYSILQTRGRKLAMVGEAGFLATSEDAGSNWQTVESPYEGSFFGASRLSSGDLLAVGLRGNAFLSKDNGATWQSLSVPTRVGLNEVVEADGDTLYIAGLSGVILKSTDRGTTFEVLQREDRTGIAGLVVTEDNNLILAGEVGLVKVNANGDDINISAESANSESE